MQVRGETRSGLVLNSTNMFKKDKRGLKRNAIVKFEELHAEK